MDDTLAFPFTPTDRSGQCGEAHPGMLLRDYFAAKAMQAIIIGNRADECALGIGAAKDAYAVADAMLAVRSDPAQNGGSEG